MSRINLHLAQIEANRIDPGSFPILLDLRGNVTESTGANILIVRNGTMVSPPDDNLFCGISRETVLELARELGLETKKCNFQPYDIYNADEAFFTTTSRCIVPIATVDGLPLSGGLPGLITMRLLKLWSDKVKVDIIEQALGHLDAAGRVD